MTFDWNQAWQLMIHSTSNGKIVPDVSKALVSPLFSLFKHISGLHSAIFNTGPTQHPAI